MDKEAFLHQLECVIPNNDKKAFIETIFDLPPDVIVGFTEEEFSRVISLSRMISLQQVDELFYFLESKGLFFIEKMLEGNDELNNSLISRFYYSLFISLAGNNKEKIKPVLIKNAIACCKIAEMGINSKENLETAVRLCRDAQEIFPKTNAYYATALMTEGNARKTFAEMGINSKENLETAVKLHRNAQGIFPKTSSNYATTLMNEGNARLRLAEMGIESKENLETAVRLYIDAKEIFPKISISYAHVLGNEGNVRQRLAEIGVDSKENLETAVRLYRNAQEILPKISADHALALMNEGSARLRLAEMGVDSKENLETAVRLYGDAQEIFPKTSSGYAGALMNEGSARQRLAEMSVNSNDNFENSKKLYLKSISILEELRDRWSYSIALLNLNSLLKSNYYKTGDKKNLEEWEKNLGDIEEKIKGRDIRYKEIVVARIHEIRASLLEFEGKAGINKASREYEKAYELSKDPFYRFMDEFCQARIDTKSFCDLVSDWKLEKKKGIFLDYYDYTVFECHLEKALKSIDEENELKLAVEKLTEIRDRTQIKIIRDRVSAYIYLLQALVDCFTEEAYTKAAKNIKEGCKIFREYGDKQGQQMCEIFNNAVVRKRDPDAWQEIIRNREFSSNFYSLLCEYSDRKRIDLEYYKHGQINERIEIVSEDVKQVKEISIRTENKIDEILSELHSGFAEIKNQIGKGFEGTDAELKKINEKINNIEQDLDNLVRISNEIDGKEGECIRKFASQMLELMKKGDYKALKRFSEKIVQNSSSFEEIIEAAEIPETEKAEAKSKLVDLKKIPGILKEKAKSFSVGVTENVIANLISGEIVDGEAIKIVSFASGEIIKLLIPVLSTAIFGVPIPSKIVEILLEAIRNS